MGTFYSGAAGNDVQSGNVSLNDTRRIFNFGERVAELAPQQSPFFVYLAKVAKKVTDDPVFKFLEQRHQWQRRNVEVKGAVTWTTHASATTNGQLAGGEGDAVIFDCGYDQYGAIAAGSQPKFMLKNQVVAVEFSDGVVRRFKIDVDPDLATDAAGAKITITSGAGVTLIGDNWADNTSYTMNDNAPAQIIGSAHAEGSTNPAGWEDKLFDREGYCQIFKTAINLFSNTARATKYRGVANEFQRIWTDKLMEHKMDIEHAMLFGMGSTQYDQSTSQPTRYTHGIVPYTESNGKVYNMSYASSGYDAFLDAMEDFFAPEGGNSGNKLVLASRKVITYLNKLGSGSFLNNSVGSSQYKLDVATIPGQFGHNVTKVNTIFGNLHFVAEPLFRGPFEDHCVAIDMKNVAYRPLAGNGINRDTFIETNIQNNNVDGRQDQVITEAGLEIQLPETHAVMKFS